MPDNNPPEPNTSASSEARATDGQASSGQASVSPFVEDDDVRALREQVKLDEQQGRSGEARSGAAAKKRRPPASETGEKPSLLGTFLLIVLGLALAALVVTSAYLFVVDPGRLLEIVRGLGLLKP